MLNPFRFVSMYFIVGYLFILVCSKLVNIQQALCIVTFLIAVISIPDMSNIREEGYALPHIERSIMVGQA